MFETLKNAFKVKEIRNKILITIVLLFVYRIGCYIPVPGVAGIWENALATDGGLSYLNIMSMMTGGALQYGSLFAMGIGPYINASIILQLLCVAIPALESLSKQGEEGRKKIAQITRYITIILAVIQSIGILVSYSDYFCPATPASDATYLPLNYILGYEVMGGFSNFLAYLVVIIIFTAGTCITMWLGERITDYGVSNGISMLIFAGILSTAGTAIISLVQGMFNPATALTSTWTFIGFIVAAVVIFAAIVAVNSAERKIPVQYAKQVKGRKMYGGQSTHIPIKVNASGVMPLIFSFAILSFPDLIINLAGGASEDWWWSRNVGTGTWIYMVLLCVLILFFSYFYNQIQFNPDDISKSIQGNGGFIPGTRPGKPTADYLKKISNRITLFGAIFLALVALIPSIIFKAIGGEGLMNVFSATGLLIIVSVALEFEQALQSQIMMKQYKGFLK